MSTSFAFNLPTTGTLNFSQHYSSDVYRQTIIHADAQRALVRDTLKQAKHSANPDIVAVIKAIDGYLPYLFTIIQSEDMFVETKVPTFSWRLPISGAKTSVIEPPRKEYAGLEYERGMVILTYALALAAYAESAVTRENASSTKWKQATAHLQKAQSLLQYLLASPVVMDDTPFDLQVGTISALATMVSGSLHLLILFKSVEDEAEEGRASVSPGLSARVAIFAADKFAALAQMLSTSPASQWAAWANNARAYCMASARKFVAIDQSKSGNVGTAIAFLQAALDTLKTSSPAGNLKSKFSRSKNSSEAMTAALKGSISDLLREYTIENDRLAFQEVPKPDRLSEVWPSGREVYPASGPWGPPPSLLESTSQSSGRAYY